MRRLKEIFLLGALVFLLPQCSTEQIKSNQKSDTTTPNKLQKPVLLATLLTNTNAALLIMPRDSYEEIENIIDTIQLYRGAHGPNVEIKKVKIFQDILRSKEKQKIKAMYYRNDGEKIVVKFSNNEQISWHYLKPETPILEKVKPHKKKKSRY